MSNLDNCFRDLKNFKSVKCKFGKETLWIHPLKLITEDVFFIFVTDTNKLGVCDDWDFDGRFDSLILKKNGSVTFQATKLLALLKTIEDPKILEDVVLKLKTEKVSRDLLEYLFLVYLNNEDFLDDVYVSDSDLKSTIECSFVNPRISVPNINIPLEKLLHHFQYYFNLDGIELEIYEIDNYDCYYSNSAEKHIWNNTLELILSVFNISGHHYVYNDGAYNRASGYNKAGAIYYVDCYSFYNQKFKKLSFVDREKELRNYNSILVESKRTIIRFLQAYAPIGIKNLKKFSKYIYN